MDNNIEQQICQAVDIIVQKAISEAGYDKTIQATIVSCIDSTIGKYEVSYQNSKFYAYTSSTDITYTKGTSVYVLIPGSDFSKNKTILGTTKKLGTSYATTIAEEDKYELYGNNCIENTDTIFSVSSYKKDGDSKYLYQKGTSINAITLNINAVNEYIKNSGYVKCGACFQTALDGTQQYQGNFGIVFALDFLDEAGETLTRYYTIDVDSMTGNPYKQISKTRQYGFFEIDNENFVEVNSIQIFAYDFPNSADSYEDDIFVSDLELWGAQLINSTTLSGTYLVFSTPKGVLFTGDQSDDATLTITAQVCVKGQKVSDSSQSITYYWFSQDASIMTSSLYYNSYGGQGWKCLNEYNLIEADEDGNPAVAEWVPASNQWTVKKSDVIADKVIYKCVAIYSDTALSKTIAIQNQKSDYAIIIESSNGIKFTLGAGETTLTCLVNNEKKENYSYVWSVTNNSGTYSALDNITCQCTVKARSINAFSTYQCSVYDENKNYIGTASIILTNSSTVEGAYFLILNNGSFAYKYNESGISPASVSLDNPITIKALTFSIYDNDGNKIDDDIVANQCEIKWIVPNINTLLSIPSSYDKYATVDEVNGVTTYSEKGLVSFVYDIADRYSITKTNNDIILQVTYKEMNLTAKTNLVFVKEGEDGTNGTEYYCRIVPWVSQYETPSYPLFSYRKIYGQDDYQWVCSNYVPNQDDNDTYHYFKAMLYDNDGLIFEGDTSGAGNDGKQIDVTWSILKNKYSGNNTDPSVFEVDSISGLVKIKDSATFFENMDSGAPANIIKVQLKHNGVYYYATLPVITTKVTDASYYVQLKKNTGFQFATYTSDGKTPKYNNANPFELEVYEDDKDITTNSATGYAWSYWGSTRIDDTIWDTSACSLEDRKLITVNGDYQKAVKPADVYNGYCVTNAVCATITKNLDLASKEPVTIAMIHIPIHLMLNKYGLAALNQWDGNSIEIDDSGGYILTPQIGVGTKDEETNTFTGIVMGEVKESNQTQSETGLFGYASGQRSIFLDAETGKAEFGVTGTGRIVINPMETTIYGGGYENNTQDDFKNGTAKGLKIDLATPSIEFGSQAFSVDSSGYMIAKGGGSIAGWSIGDTAIYSTAGTGTASGEGLVDNTNSFRLDTKDFTRNIKLSDETITSVEHLRLAIGDKFAVDAEGNVYSRGANYVIDAGDITLNVSPTIPSLGGWNVDNSSLYTGISTSKTTILSSEDVVETINNVSRSSLRLVFGNSFAVDKDGIAYIGEAYLGSDSSTANKDAIFHLSGNAITYKKTAFTSTSEGIYLGTTDGIALGAYSTTSRLGNHNSFSVDTSGYAIITNGNLGGWRLTESGFHWGDTASGTPGLNDTSGLYLGGSGVRLGNVFKYTLTNNNLTLGSWTVTNSGLTSTDENATISGVVTITGQNDTDVAVESKKDLNLRVTDDNYIYLTATDVDHIKIYDSTTSGYITLTDFVRSLIEN